MTDVRTLAVPLLRRAWQLPVVAALTILSVTTVGPRPELVGFLFLAGVSAELARIDVIEHRLPNRILLPGYLVALTGLGFGWTATGEPPVVPLVAGAASFGLLLIMNLAGGMGMGDVKLGGLIGLCLGSLGITSAILGPVLGFVIGGTAGAVALIGGRGGRRIAFGPFLLGGFWGSTVLSSPAVVELLG